jgi:hypothetical protein
VTQTNCKADLLCLSDAVLADAVATTGPICTKPCCKSEECPASFVCYGPGTGGSYCVKAAVLSRGALLGTAPGGTTCARGAECRSGVCLGSAGNMVCADACCTHTDCAGSNTVCRRTLVDAHNVFACGVPAAGAGASDDPCSGPGACQSGVCIAAGFQGECKPRCCGRQSCAQQTPSYSTCAYVQTAGAPEYLGVCLHSGENPTGSKDLGAACTNDDECQTAFCDPVAKRCTDVCCVDNDCAAYPGTKCRPSSNPHFLTCQ